jgi:hypothetical protein
LLLTLVIVAVSCSSCVIIPIPTPGRVAGDSRGHLRDEALAFLQVGRTTRAEVLLNLGEPERAWREQRLFVYYWETEPFWIAGVVYPAAGGAAPVRWRVHFLLLEFDEAGLLKRRRPGDIPLYGLVVARKDFSKNPAAYRSLGLQREIPEW